MSDTESKEVPEAEGRGLKEMARGALTAKAFVMGIFLTFVIAVCEPYGNMIIKGSYMAIDFTTGAAVFLFFVLVAIVNTVLRLIDKQTEASGRSAVGVAVAVVLGALAALALSKGKGSGLSVVTAVVCLVAALVVLIGSLRLVPVTLAFSRSELIVIYIMMAVACSIPSMGLTEYLLPILPACFYYATPENAWLTDIKPHIPHWMVPTDALAIKYFYEGLPKGEAIPWAAWVMPLLCWGVLLIAIYFVMICMMVLLRRQWVERERLIYPLTRLPVEMVEEADEPGIVTPFFKSRLMWIGFLIPVIVGSLKGLHNYYPFVPVVPTYTRVDLFNRLLRLDFRLSFAVVGFTYLINLDIAFSIWMFNWLAKIQRTVCTHIGFTSTEDLGIYGVSKFPDLAHQGMGAMMVLVVFGLWIGRRHLIDVIRKAFRGDPDVDDDAEILSYRTAFFGMLLGLAFIAIWLKLSGLPVFPVLLFLFGAFVLFVGLTRIVVEGVGEGVASTISSSFVVSGIGTGPLGASGLTALGFTYVWAADIRTYVMASTANSLKLTEGLGRKQRGIFWAILATVLVSMAVSIVTILYLAYRHGGINLNNWFFRSGPQVPFKYVATNLQQTPGLNVRGWVFTFIGSGVMVLLMLARHHFLWWPLHPIGFPVGAVWLMDQIWASIALACIAKFFILRYGGHKLFRAFRPFALGLILGTFTCPGVWLIIDFFTGKQGNQIFWI